MRFSFIGFGLVLSAVSAFSATIHVPADQPTIQAGINAAVNGDTVLVAPGTYVENVDFLNKIGITLLSSGGRDVTFVEPPSSGSSVITVSNASDSTSVIEGFTIRNALGASGVFCTGSPTIQHCDISYCSATYGAGIRCLNSWPVIRFNRIHHNDDATYGGGIEVEQNNNREVIIAHNEFYANSAAYGSGVASVWGGGENIHDNLFRDNGGTFGDYSAAVFAFGTVHQIINNTIVGNMGGIYLQGGSPSASVTNNIVVNNERHGIYGGGANIDYNDVWNNGASNNPGPNGISLDPMFTDTANGDYTLQPNSPCIDAGHPDPQYNDPDGTRNDMGAFPYTASLLPYVVSMAAQSEGRFNIVSHIPTFNWTYASPGGGQMSRFEIAVGTDANWDYAEMWNPAPYTSLTPSAAYGGSTLIDGQFYYLRLRIEDAAGWSPWYNWSFRMNSVPTIPNPLSPKQDNIAGSTPKLWIQNSSDPENDTRTYEFVGTPDVSCPGAPVISLTGVAQGSDSTGGTVATALGENCRYTWKARAYDGHEYSGWSPEASFYVDGIPEPPAPYSLISPPLQPNVPEFHLKPALDWSDAIDPDPFDTVSYLVDISINPSFLFTATFGPMLGSTLTLADSLLFNFRYWWRVRATDKDGYTITSSAVKDFWTWWPGDIDYSHAIDGSDLQWFVDYMFFNITLPSPAFVGDLDGDCVTDGSDLQVMIDHMFFLGPQWRGLCVP